MQADTEVQMTIGRRSIAATARPVSSEDAELVLREYGERHRLAMRALGRMFGSTDPHELAGVLPIVAIGPRGSSGTERPGRE